MSPENRGQLRSEWEIYKTLLWKELTEQRWRLIASLGIACPLLLLPFFMAVLEVVRGQRTSGGFMDIMPGFHMSILSLIAPFVAMSLAGSEQRRGTMRFLQALPTDLTKIATVKIVGAALVIILPVLVLFFIGLVMWLAFTALGSFVEWPVRWQAERLLLALGLEVLMLLSALSLLVWMASAGLNQQDEIRSGAIGFLICISLWFLLFVISSIVNWPDEFMRLFAVGLPGGFMVLASAFDHGETLVIAGGLMFAAITHGLVLRYYLRHYGRVAIAPHRGSIASKLEQLSLVRFTPEPTALTPFSTTWGAIAWKQMRETGPLVVLAVAGALVGAMAIHARTLFGYRSPNTFSELLFSIGMATAVLVLIVAGIGVFFEDLSPKTNVFWRSRPANTNQWFALKWLTGLLIPLFGFGVLFLLALSIEPTVLTSSERWWSAFWAVAFWICGLAVLIYSLAVCFYIFFRQAIYAALATIGTLLIFFFWTNAVSHGPNHVSPYLPVFLGILMSAISLLLAWTAIRFDWGWKEGR